jgi:hypothetical protein
MKTMVKLLILVMGIAVASPALARTLKVDCNRGGTITKALENAKPFDTIQVTGTCKERFTITTDRLTLDGQGSAILDAGGGFHAGAIFYGAITIDGARGVTVTGFTIQHGPDGITCKRGAACLVRNSTLQDNADEGMQVSENSTAEVTDSTFRRNGEWGIVVFDNSSLLFHGTVNLTHNGKSGLGVLFTSTAGSFSGATIHFDNNKDHGIFVVGGSMVQIDREGGTVTMNNNKQNGIGLLDSVLMLWNGTLTIVRNGGNGIFVGARSSLQNFAATFVVKNNEGAGLLVDNGGIVFMKGATITGNSTDVALSSDARATLKGNTIGTITCDKSSRITGDTVCPGLATK